MDEKQVSSLNFAANSSNSSTECVDREIPVYSVWEIFAIVSASTLTSLLTVGANTLVIIAFITNKQLRTINNYLIINLAVADFIVGLVSMNFYTAYIVMQGWSFGPYVCDAWLTLDYVASNTSVMNLLIICIDRYLSVTFPVKYRNKRKVLHAKLAMLFAWVVSFVLWAPWIIGWQYIVKKRTVPPNDCYIQFIQDGQFMSVITTLAAFYLPACVMVILYYKVYVGLQKRAKMLGNITDDENGLTIARRSIAAVIKTVRKIVYKDDRDREEVISSISNDETFRNNGNLTQTEEFSESNTPTPEQIRRHLRINSFNGSDISEDLLERPSVDRLQAGQSSPKTNPKSIPKVKKLHLSLNKEQRAARLLFAIITVFILLWSPYNIMALYASKYGFESISDWAWALGYWLCYLNSTLNPACYAACNKTFKKTFKNILTGRGLRTQAQIYTQKPDKSRKKNCL